jgi:hypothetical protein
MSQVWGSDDARVNLAMKPGSAHLDVFHPKWDGGSEKEKIMCARIYMHMI